MSTPIPEPYFLDPVALALAKKLGAALYDAGVRWASIGKGPLGSWSISVSFEPKSEWANGIFENSRGAKFLVHDDRQLVHLTGWRVSKLRARKLKDSEHLIAVLVKWASENAKNEKA